MAVTTAGNAAVKYGATTVTGVANATVSASRTLIETTAISSTYRTHASGILEGTVALDFYWDSKDDATHAALFGNLSAGSAITDLTVEWESGAYIKGDALVQDISITTAPNGVALATMNLVFSGDAMTLEDGAA